MKRRHLIFATLGAGGLASAVVTGVRYARQEQADRPHFDREETELVVTNATPSSPAHLFRAGKSLEDAEKIETLREGRRWLARGNYFLQVDEPRRTLFYPVPVTGYDCGPDRDGSLAVTIRESPAQQPPKLLDQSAPFVYIPSGHFLLGDRLNPGEPHFVWLSGYFIASFEVTNAEFRAFLAGGYADDHHWTDGGKQWKAQTRTASTAALTPRDTEFQRFGQPDQPVVSVTWFEANAYCHWLTATAGANQWIFSLPNDAEWEKAARGPDNLDYALSMAVSDQQVDWYNWRKNPTAPVTVVGYEYSRSHYKPNRYGLYHMTGNAAEWTQSLFIAYNRQRPFADDSRNLDESSGRRTVRGGSWYSASTGPLYTPYRDAFQPEHNNNDLGFRVVARLRP